MVTVLIVIVCIGLVCYFPRIIIGGLIIGICFVLLGILGTNTSSYSTKNEQEINYRIKDAINYINADWAKYAPRAPSGYPRLIISMRSLNEGYSNIEGRVQFKYRRSNGFEGSCGIEEFRVTKEYPTVLIDPPGCGNNSIWYYIKIDDATK